MAQTLEPMGRMIDCGQPEPRRCREQRGKDEHRVAYAVASGSAEQCGRPSRLGTRCLIEGLNGRDSGSNVWLLVNV